MLKAILFDLDDTLLGNDMDNFIAHYFKLLGRYARPLLDEQTFIQYYLQATRAVMVGTDTSRTNREVLWDHFERLSGRPRNELEPFFGRFYNGTTPPTLPTPPDLTLASGYGTLDALYPLLQRGWPFASSN